MKGYPDSIQRVVDNFRKLPGIGAKSAERLAFALLKRRREEAVRLSDAIREMAGNIGYCEQCRNYTEGTCCSICSDKGRDKQLICVVEQPEDVLAIERVGEFTGLYFILHGSISPLDGLGPEELGLEKLEALIDQLEIREIIIATNPNVAGEATAIYIARRLKGKPVQVSRIALGIPAGGNIGYADEVTMMRALEGRTRIILE
ncbi:MAG: recombination protein RecR [Acidobacteria bacterium CG_4_9_14_3_um_filter_49_7]|nr:MAG: recombination protein RecR [Acidobacteria bacterium CG_4_9_14_3_um_filter_49_7]